jgi:putative addiction module component (TIGR02574 family)
MSDTAARLLTKALRLSEEERGEIAAQLIDSLEATADINVEGAWDAESRQRLDELRSGQTKPIPWPEARRMILD